MAFKNDYASIRKVLVTEISQKWCEGDPTDSFLCYFYSDQPINCPHNQTSRAITKAVSFPVKRGGASCKYELERFVGTSCPKWHVYGRQGQPIASGRAATISWRD